MCSVFSNFFLRNHYEFEISNTKYGYENGKELMGINIFSREEMTTFLYFSMGMGWECEYGHGNGR